ncbi:hypothetical protein HanRHA438_Chr16g0759371 [Helianthus annuus]|nr:hypothetical protein HanRHA438_Chr16g0759371 [Helianthus annuus]
MAFNNYVLKDNNYTNDKCCKLIPVKIRWIPYPDVGIKVNLMCCDCFFAMETED